MGTESVDEIVKENETPKKKGAWLKPVATIGTLLAIVLIIVIGRTMEIKIGLLIISIVVTLLAGIGVFFFFDVLRKFETLTEDKKESIPRALSKEDFKKYLNKHMLLNYIVNLKEIGTVRDKVINGEQISYAKIYFSPKIEGQSEAHIFANLHYLSESNLKTNQNMIVEFNHGIAEQKINKFQNDLATTPMPEADVRSVETFNPFTNTYMRTKEKSRQQKNKQKEDLK